MADTMFDAVQWVNSTTSADIADEVSQTHELFSDKLKGKHF